VYTWDMLSGPSRDGSDLWSRRATRQILLDLSMFDIFDLDDPCLGSLHLSGQSMALYLTCCDVLLIFDLSQKNNVQLEVLTLDQEFLAFSGYYRVDEQDYFVFDEEIGDEQRTAIYTKTGDKLTLYTRVNEPTNNNTIVYKDLNMYIPAAEGATFFLIKLDCQDLIERQIPLRPTINFLSPGCRFRLEIICSQVVALCNCPGHVVAFNLSSFRNIFTNVRCLLDLDTSLNIITAPPRGKDYVVHFKNAKNSFFGQLGSWFRIWCDKGVSRCEKWHFTPNHKIHLPKEMSNDTNVYQTMLHSRSRCSRLYEYFPPHSQDEQVPILNIFF